MHDACETPMRDHLERFWQLLGEGKVRILIDSHHAEGFGGTGHWTSSSFPDDVAKALLAERRTIWQPIETAPKTGEFIWLSNGRMMRIGYWYVVTADPSQEHWADMIRAERGGMGDLQWKPEYWLPLPKSPHRLTGSEAVFEPAPPSRSHPTHTSTKTTYLGDGLYEGMEP